jgi:hypothetical protein
MIFSCQGFYSPFNLLYIHIPSFKIPLSDLESNSDSEPSGHMREVYVFIVTYRKYGFYYKSGHLIMDIIDTLFLRESHFVKGY